MTDQSIGGIYLESARARFRTMKKLGEHAMKQMSDADLVWTSNPECNSVAMLVQHLHGNMLSRWTDVLTTDGEKPGRNRDGEFIVVEPIDRGILMAKWEEGWTCLLAALDSFTADDLLKPATIRGQKLPVVDAINRQVFHVSYHVGQMLQIAKERLGDRWETASIPRGQSEAYVAGKGD